MLRSFKDLDRLLRGELTHAETLAGYTDGKAARFSLRRFVPMAIGLGAAYGFFMGWYALALNWTKDPGKGWQQLIAGMVKLPALFILTLLVTFPSLYVFNALVGTRLGFIQVLRLLVAAIVVNLTVAASLGTILGFFTLSTTSYHFMVVLNVILLGISGAVSLGFLLHTLKRLSAPEHTLGEPAPAPTAAPTSESAAGAIFYIWLVIYSLVGMQMGWLLRPFIGHPNAQFEWFRDRSGNFFQGLAENIQRMLGS